MSNTMYIIPLYTSTPVPFKSFVLQLLQGRMVLAVLPWEQTPKRTCHTGTSCIRQFWYHLWFMPWIESLNKSERQQLGNPGNTWLMDRWTRFISSMERIFTATCCPTWVVKHVKRCLQRKVYPGNILSFHRLRCSESNVSTCWLFAYLFPLLCDFCTRCVQKFGRSVLHVLLLCMAALNPLHGSLNMKIGNVPGRACGETQPSVSCNSSQKPRICESCAGRAAGTTKVFLFG